MNALTRLTVPLATICIVALGATQPISAQPATLPAAKHDAAILRGALKDVINTGAELFNKDGDHAGCYRLYQGALSSLKPFLPPATQKEIEDSLAATERLPRYSDRAFALRKVINGIRAQASRTVPKVGNPQGAKGKVSGSVSFDGKPAPAGYITFVGADQRRYSTIINQDGTYAFPMPLPVGRYRVALERPSGQKSQGPAIPARYRGEQTSDLTVEVRLGNQALDVQLQK